MSTQPSLGRILFVDDEDSVRRLFVMFLSGEGYEVHAASDVSGAIALVFGNVYDVVIVDKNLPDGSGLDIIHACRERTPDVELMVLTGYPSTESALEAIRCRACEYFVKPLLDLDVVLTGVRNAIARRRHRAEARTALAELLDRIDRAQRAIGAEQPVAAGDLLGRAFESVVHLRALIDPAGPVPVGPVGGESG